MARLSLTLRGGFHAGLDDDRTPALSIKKAQALLAYLSIPAGKSHLCDKLATLLWGEMREAQARGGLRRALFTLRRALGDAKPLRLEGEGVALDPALVAIDVQEFEECAGFRDQPCSATRSTRAGIARAVRWARSAGRTRWSGAHPRAAPRRRAARGAALEGERGDHRRAIERMRWVAGALKDASIDEHFGRVGLPPTSACRPWLALCLATGDFAEALAWGGEGLGIAEAAGGPHERVWAGHCLGRAHLARGDGAQAIPSSKRRSHCARIAFPCSGRAWSQASVAP